MQMETVSVDLTWHETNENSSQRRKGDQLESGASNRLQGGRRQRRGTMKAKAPRRRKLHTAVSCGGSSASARSHAESLRELQPHVGVEM